MWSLRHIWLTALAFACGGSLCPAGDTEKAAARTERQTFQASQRQFQQKFHSRRSEDRVDAVRNLAETPLKDATELLWRSGLSDRSEMVRLATVARLAEWRDREGVAEWLLDHSQHAARKTQMDSRAYGVVRALAGSERESVQKRTLQFVDEFLGTVRCDQGQMHTLCDDLGAQGDADALRSLTLFSNLKFFDANFGFRRCVMQGVMRVAGDDTVTFLIRVLPRLQGLVQYDVVQHLTGLTGQRLGTDAKAWEAWWASQNRKLPKERPMVPPPEQGDAPNTYYGLPIGASRVVFVLDASGSMAGAKLEAAKRELVQAIDGLPPDVQFSVIAFRRGVTVWQRSLVPANKVFKQQAIQMVRMQDIGGGTSSYDALAAAFELEPEAVYFASDGAPTSGRIVDPGEIVTSVKVTNHVRRVSVYSIGIDIAGSGAAVFGKFMHQLADRNWGECVEVDGR